jgi:hypothetical protein
MTYVEALDIVVARTRHERFRELCADGHPDHGAWRAEMIRRAGGVEAYPSLVTQAGSALKAAAGFIASGGAVVTREEHDRRRGICGACEHLDAARDRCRKCGCFLAAKPWMAREHCPIQKW